MSTAREPHTTPEQEIDRALSDARHYFQEQPERALTEARRCGARADALGNAVLRARALALECVVAIHRGNMREALTLAVDAGRLAGSTEDPVTRAELEAASATFGFFSGSYAEAMRQADLAIEHADDSGDVALRVYVRGVAAMVFGNVGVRDRLNRFEEMLDLAVVAEDPWQEALTRNNIACHHLDAGQQELAERWIAEARAIAEQLPGENAFTLAVVNSSQADIHLASGRGDEALRSARRSLTLLEMQEMPNPYVFAASIRAELQAQIALGNYGDAQTIGEEALDWLGERLPRARAQVLATYAEALREAGHHEEAYRALTRSVEIERQSFSELSDLQLILERATLEARVARREADRDWLTGLYNRRFLARELERITQERRAGSISVAAIDLDHFKDINDRFGHSIGDRVLVQAANLVNQLTRETDITVRSGGEEFLILMPQTETPAANRCAHRIHAAIQEQDWSELAPGLRVTVSVGIASSGSVADLPNLIARADQNLYAAKHAGRNRVATESQATAAGDQVA